MKAIKAFEAPKLIAQLEKRSRGRPRLAQLRSQMCFWTDKTLEYAIKDAAKDEKKTVSCYCRDILKKELGLK